MPRKEYNGPVQQLFLASLVSHVFVLGREKPIDGSKYIDHDLIDLIKNHPVLAVPFFLSFLVE